MFHESLDQDFTNFLKLLIDKGRITSVNDILKSFIHKCNEYLNIEEAIVYSARELKPEDLAKNLKENGGFIPGVRPGKDSENYFSAVLSKLTVIGGIFLVIIAGLPIIFSNLSGLPSTVTIGGTSLLIVVGVALETYKQLEGSLVSRNYKKGYSRR